MLYNDSFIIKDVDLFPSNKIRLQNTHLYTLHICIICDTINAIQLLLCNSNYTCTCIYIEKMELQRPSLGTYASIIQLDFPLK